MKIELSERELQVLTLIAEDCLYSKEIARRLGVSKHTVQTYIHRLRVKLNARNVLELVKIYWSTPEEREFRSWGR